MKKLLIIPFIIGIQCCTNQHDKNKPITSFDTTIRSEMKQTEIISTGEISYTLPFIFNEKSFNKMINDLEEDKLKGKSIQIPNLSLEQKALNLRTYSLLQIDSFIVALCIYKGPFAETENKEYRLINTNNQKENYFLGGLVNVEEGEFIQYFEISENKQIIINDVMSNPIKKLIIQDNHIVEK